LGSVRILSFQSGLHDASAAAFEDYRLVAAVQEERLRREKGWGNDVPWLAIDEVLRIAGWARNEVDVIALIRGVFPLHYFSFPLPRDIYYTVRKHLAASGSIAISPTQSTAAVPATTNCSAVSVFRREWVSRGYPITLRQSS
jgi:predicted NodU family carbamoyl transferase